MKRFYRWALVLALVSIGVFWWPGPFVFTYNPAQHLFIGQKRRGSVSLNYTYSSSLANLTQLKLESEVNYTVVLEPSAKESASSTQVPPAGVKWPQSDDRMQRAISAGERIDPTPNITRNGTHFYEWNGTEYEAPVDKLATIVSMFYDLSDKTPGISGKRPVKDYQTWLANFLSCTDPMVFFCEPHSDWADFVREHRQHAPTIIVALPFDRLTTHTNFNNTFWLQEGTAKDPYDNTPFRRKKQTGVYKLWNEKIIMVHEVSLVNPFDTDHFVWIDAGYYRSHAMNGVIVRNNMTQNGLQPHQTLFHLVRPESEGYMIAGGCWGASATGIQNLYDHYWRTFWFMATKDIPCLCYEQHVFVHTCKSFPDICSVHVNEYMKWFDIGTFWLPNATFDFSEPIMLNGTVDLSPGNPHGPRLKQTVVNGEITFPRKFPILSVSDSESNVTGRRLPSIDFWYYVEDRALSLPSSNKQS